MLYRITHADRDAVVLVFGTMHLGVHEAYVHNANVLPYIRSSSRYFGETNLDDTKQEIFQSTFVLPEGQSWLEDFTPAARRRYAAYWLKHHQVDIVLLQHMQPLIAMSTLINKLLSPSMPALDQYLWSEAKRCGIPTGGLESASKQAEILKALPYEYQLKQLRNLLSNVTSHSRKQRKLIAAYSRGDLTYLYKASSASLGHMRGLLLYNRNAYMADEIDQHARSETGRLFFSIGAGHLPGLKGVLRLLKTMGYKLERI